MGTQQDPLLLFTPVPLARVRRNGWSPERQIAFIARLADCGVVRTAAVSVGMSARSAYQLLDRVPWDHPFALAWDAAMDRARAAAFALAERALTELERVPITYRGRVVGWRTRLNEKMAIAALRHMFREEHHEGRLPTHFEQRWTQIRRRDMAESRAREAAPPPPPPSPPAPLSPPPLACAPTPRRRPPPQVRLL